MPDLSGIYGIFSLITRDTLHFLSLQTYRRNGSRRLFFVHCVDRSVCSSLFLLSFCLHQIHYIRVFFLYIANLACNSADDVDGRHWLVGADGDEYISCDDEQTTISLSLSLSRSVYFFFFFCIFFSSVYSRCVCVCVCALDLVWEQEDRERESERTMCLCLL